MSNAPTTAPPDFNAGDAAQQAAAEAKLKSGQDGKVSFYNDNGTLVPKDPGQWAQDLGWSPAYGGYAGGANDFYNYTQGLAAQARGFAAPVMNLDAANADRAQGLAALAQQQGGLSALAAQGAGRGPGAIAAQAGFNVAGNQSMLAALQASGTGRGAVGMAAAQQQAQAGNAASQAAAAQQAGAARASAALQGQQAYQQGAQGYSQGVAGLAGADWDTSAKQAQMQEQQRSMNQTASLGYLGLGQSALGAEGQAAAGVYAANLGNTTAANALAAQQTISNWNMGLGAVSSAGGAVSQLGKQQPSPGSTTSTQGIGETEDTE